jgi:hypothetical protein
MWSGSLICVERAFEKINNGSLLAAAKPAAKLDHPDSEGGHTDWDKKQRRSAPRRVWLSARRQEQGYRSERCEKRKPNRHEYFYEWMHPEVPFNDGVSSGADKAAEKEWSERITIGPPLLQPKRGVAKLPENWLRTNVTAC